MQRIGSAPNKGVHRIEYCFGLNLRIVEISISHALIRLFSKNRLPEDGSNLRGIWLSAESVVAEQTGGIASATLCGGSTVKLRRL